jgi:O-6-methylguanine DNA methyltransferase
VGETLVLQNDLGITDAHVLVIHVSGKTVTVTYTDVHLARLLFFQSLFEGYDVSWEDTRSRKAPAMEDGVYHLCVGSYTAPGSTQLRRYLDRLGSRLVFLIDWNRARKALRPFLRKRAALELLEWAADRDVGHVAWLKLGGAQLVFDAMSYAHGGQLRPGERLDHMLTEGRAVEFLRFTLRRAFSALSQGRPASLVADEVRAELASQVRSTEDAMLDTALEHAGLIVELADTVRSVLAFLDEPRLALDLPLDLRGTAFQQRVWRALRQIPPGETRTYGEVAAAIGDPRAVRAVARSCAANPVSLAVPCHRVIGKDGDLTGYRWGVPRKRALLEKERAAAGKAAA